MIITKPQQPKKTIYDYIKMLGDGFDIGDNTYDWGTYFGCETDYDKCTDYYDKCMYIFALNIEMLNYSKDWYSTCKVSEFISENINAFETFLNEIYREEYTPRYLKAHGHKVNDMNIDDYFYDTYLQAFEALVVGNFAESDYKLLFELLTQDTQKGE